MHKTADPIQHQDPQTSPGASRAEICMGLSELRPRLYARALGLSRSPSQAEDIVQDTAIRALRFADQYRAGTQLYAWLSQILSSVFLTQCRRRGRERRALAKITHDPCAWVRRDPEPIMQSLSAKPARALAQLPPCYRDAVKLVDLEQLSYRAAAARLAVPVGTVMSRLYRGRKLLAAALTPPAAPVPLAA